MTTTTAHATPETTVDAFTRTWTVTPLEATLTARRVAQINKRLTKRGFTGLVTLTTGEPYTVTDTREDGSDVTVVVVDITLSGRPAQYEGWTFVAAVDTIERADNVPGFVVRCAPGMDVTADERAMLEPYACQHCQTMRANRRYTYLLRNTSTGEATQVGKTCMADFLGVPVAPSMFPTADTVDDALDGCFGGGSAREQYAPEYIVALSAALCGERGYISRARAEDDERLTATADLVSTFLHNPKGRAAMIADDPALAHLDTNAAAAMIKDVLDAPADSTYLINLSAALSGIAVEDRNIGLIASTPAAHHNITTTAAEKAAREAEKAEREAAKAEITYAGTVGEKLTATVTVTARKLVASAYGSSTLIVMRDDAHVFKAFTSAAWARDVQAGDTLTITGTVKAHSEYDGVRETVLTRVKPTK